MAVRIPNRPGLVVYSCNAALAEWRQEGWEFTLTTGLMAAWVTWNLVYSKQTESQLGQTWRSRCHPSTRRPRQTGFCECEAKVPRQGKQSWVRKTYLILPPAPPKTTVAHVLLLLLFICLFVFICIGVWPACMSV